MMKLMQFFSIALCAPNVHAIRNGHAPLHLSIMYLHLHIKYKIIYAAFYPRNNHNVGYGARDCVRVHVAISPNTRNERSSYWMHWGTPLHVYKRTCEYSRCTKFVADDELLYSVCRSHAPLIAIIFAWALSWIVFLTNLLPTNEDKPFLVNFCLMQSNDQLKSREKKSVYSSR